MHLHMPKWKEEVIPCQPKGKCWGLTLQTYHLTPEAGSVAVNCQEEER